MIDLTNDGSVRNPGIVQELRSSRFAETVRQDQLVVFLRRVDPAVSESVFDALQLGGIRLVEVTLDSKGALATIEQWRGRDLMTVGAGTVRSVDDVDAAVDAGAEFVVSPTYRQPVLDRCLERGIPCIPGALTPTEVEEAWAGGATFVKLYPGALMGPSYLSTLLAPLHDIQIVVTGGITTETAPGYLNAGAVGVGVSAVELTGNGVNAPADPDDLALNVAALVAARDRH
jgi:2-dehydro-3-deoxyphosphogluconate aldolase/(4S)-4-hydroxy-2-oxoglutarate aldolase